MAILITGGAGFIGSHVCSKLVKVFGVKPCDIVVVDNFSTGRIDNILCDVNVENIDICSKSLEKVFKKYKIDKVVHLAAQVFVDKSFESPTNDCNINLNGTLNLLEMCRKYNVSNVVFASSAAVYGNNENVPLKECEQLNPLSFYGISKMTCERYLKLYYDVYGINCTALRLANVYGERQALESADGGVISVFCKALCNDDTITIYGDGCQTRDFIYAGDVAEVMCNALKLKGFHIMNVSTEKETSLNELLATFEKVIGMPIMFKTEESKIGDVRKSLLSNQECRNVLKYVPSIKLEEGLRRTFRDYCKRCE